MQIADYVNDGRRVLGTVPTQKRVVLERFFDESGGMQMVLHAPFGGRINRAWGLALRKRFCRGFGFELQAAANEEAIVISLGPQHSFPLEDVFNFLHPDSVRKVLTQAVLDQPMFESRWRWNATPVADARAVSERQAGAAADHADARRRPAGGGVSRGGRVPGEPAAGRPADPDGPPARPPDDRGLPHRSDRHRGADRGAQGAARRLDRAASRWTRPSRRRSRAGSSTPSCTRSSTMRRWRSAARRRCCARRSLDDRSLDGVGALDPAAVERVRSEAWPQPETAEEVHDALLWMGFVTDAEAATGRPWLDDARGAEPRASTATGDGSRSTDRRSRRRSCSAGSRRWGRCSRTIRASRSTATSGAAAASWSTKARSCARAWTGDARGASGGCWRGSIATRSTACAGRSSRSRAAEFLQFLACWQHVDEEYMLEGPHGVARGAAAARRVRDARVGVGGPVLPRRVARLSARVAR